MNVHLGKMIIDVKGGFENSTSSIGPSSFQYRRALYTAAQIHKQDGETQGFNCARP